MVEVITAFLKAKCSAIWNCWASFWFTPSDPLNLSLLRILTGCMLLYSHCIWGVLLFDFLGEQGWNRSSLLHWLSPEGVGASFLWYVPTTQLAIVHWLCGFVIAMSILGVGGRSTSFLTWMIAVSYSNRSSLANFGLDQILCILTLYLVIAPATQRFSGDAWWRKWRQKKKGTGEPNPKRTFVSATIATRFLQLHLCFIYLWAGLSKLQGEAWWNGEAFWLAVANQEYQSLDLTWLSHYPRFTEVCTHLTVAWELSFCALIWPRSTRYLMLLVGVGLHLGIGLFLGMWTFGSIMIFAYLSFVPPGVWSNLRGFIRGRLDLKQFKEVGLVHGGIIPTELDPKQGITEDLSLRQEVAVTCDSEEENSQQYSFPILQRDGIEFMQNIILVSENREVLRRMVPVFSKSDRQIVAVASFQEAEILSHLIPNAIVLTGSNVSDTSEPCLFLKVVQGIELTKGSNQPQANVGRVSKDPEERMLTDESPQCQEDPLGDDENSEEWNSNVDVVKLPR